MMYGKIAKLLSVIYCFALIIIFTASCGEVYKNTENQPIESSLEASEKMHNGVSIIASVEGYTEEDGMAVVKIMSFLEKRGDISNSEIVFAEDRTFTYMDIYETEQQATALCVQTEDEEEYYLLIDYSKVYAVYHGAVEQSKLIWYSSTGSGSLC